MRILHSPDANTDPASSAGPDGAVAPDANQQTAGTSPAAPATGGDATPPEPAKQTVAEFVEQQLAKTHDGLPSLSKPESDDDELAQDLSQSDDGKPKPEGDKPKGDKTERSLKAKPDGKDNGEKPPPFNKHPAFRRVVDERDQAKAELDKAKPRLESLTKFEDFIASKRISAEQLNQALELTALANADPAKARVELQKLIDNLDKVSGEKLPDDLDEKYKEVEALAAEKVLDQETAQSILDNIKETARLRANAEFGKTRAKADAMTAQQRFVTDTVTALNAWDDNKAKMDPDFKEKQPLIQQAYVALMQVSRPTSPQQAVAMAEQAYTFVNERLDKLTPKPRTRKTLVSEGSATNTRRARPATAKEAVAEMLRTKHGIDFSDDEEE